MPSSDRTVVSNMWLCFGVSSLDLGTYPQQRGFLWLPPCLFQKRCVIVDRELCFGIELEMSTVPQEDTGNGGPWSLAPAGHITFLPTFLGQALGFWRRSPEENWVCGAIFSLLLSLSEYFTWLQNRVWKNSSSEFGTLHPGLSFLCKPVDTSFVPKFGRLYDKMLAVHFRLL